MGRISRSMAGTPWRALWIFCFLGGGAVLPAGACDLDLQNHFGPYDYHDPKTREKLGGGNSPLRYVEDYHLTSDMLKLVRGATNVAIGPDIDYTLRAIPNHPQALDLASRLEYALKTGRIEEKFGALRMPTECYFQRALQFRPKQGVTHYVQAIHLHRNGHYQEARKAYVSAEALGNASGEFYYNYGLTLFELGEFDGAREMAEKAREKGYPLTGLQNKLAKAGKPKSAPETN